MGLGCQVLDQQHLSFSKTLCILSSAPCRKGSQSLPCSALGRSIPLLQKLQQHSKSSKQLWFRTAQAQFQAILHLGSAAQATRLGSCKIRPLAPGERGQSCTPSFGGLWKSTGPRLFTASARLPSAPRIRGPHPHKRLPTSISPAAQGPAQRSRAPGARGSREARDGAPPQRHVDQGSQTSANPCWACDASRAPLRGAPAATGRLRLAVHRHFIYLLWSLLSVCVQACARLSPT